MVAPVESWYNVPSLWLRLSLKPMSIKGLMLKRSSCNVLSGQMMASIGPSLVFLFATVEWPFPNIISVNAVACLGKPWASTVDSRSRIASAPVSNRAVWWSIVAANAWRGTLGHSQSSAFSWDGAWLTSSIATSAIMALILGLFSRLSLKFLLIWGVLSERDLAFLRVCSVEITDL